MQVEFLRSMTASMLSERRAIAPFGLCGGHSAARGLNLLIKKDGRVVNIGSKSTFRVEGGDRLRILTPGGLACPALGRRLRKASSSQEVVACNAGGGGYGSPAGSEQKDKSRKAVGRGYSGTASTEVVASTRLAGSYQEYRLRQESA